MLKRKFLLLSAMVSFFCYAKAQQKPNGAVIELDSSYRVVFILPKDKSKPILHYFYDYILVVKNDSIRILYPKDIKGYNIKNKTFISKAFKTQNGTLNVFCESIISGNANLFLYNGSLSEKEDLYIFNRKSDPNFYYIKSTEPKLKGYQDEPGYGYQDLTFQKQMNTLLSVISDDQHFEAYFSRYFRECDIILSKIKQHWYAGNNFKTLFLDYNNSCNK